MVRVQWMSSIPFLKWPGPRFIYRLLGSHRAADSIYDMFSWHPLIEVRGFLARDIWLLGVVLSGLSQIQRVPGTSPPPSPPSSGPNISKSAISSKWTCPRIPGDVFFLRSKSPCGSVPQKGTFSELTFRELIHYRYHLKNGGYLNFLYFGNVFLRLCQFWSKIKMVRMVHTVNFYEMGLGLSGQKNSCGPKVFFWGVGHFRIQFLWSQMDFWGFLQDQHWFSKKNWTIPESSRLNFHIFPFHV